MKTRIILHAALIIAAVTAGRMFAADNTPLSFRTFTSQELAVASPVQVNAVVTRWEFKFVNHTSTSAAGLHVEFNGDVKSFSSCSAFSSSTYSINGARVTYVLSDGLVPAGEDLSLEGTGSPDFTKAVRFWWTDAEDNAIGAIEYNVKPASLVRTSPLPNPANARATMFASNDASPIVIGVASAKTSWVSLKTSEALLRSLDENGVTHTGMPHGFRAYDNGTPMNGEQTALLPTMSNNSLFPELVALKFNIRMCEAGIAPHGFCHLLFHEGNNPLNGMTVFEISAHADSMMSFPQKYSAAEYINLYATARKINGAFSGPIETVATVSTLEFTGVQNPEASDFLHQMTAAPSFSELGADGNLAVGNF